LGRSAAVDPSALDVTRYCQAVLGDAYIGAAFLMVAAKDGAFDINLGAALVIKDCRANFMPAPRYLCS
jgi:hypothetical protein